jgi:hypothetical protein
MSSAVFDAVAGQNSLGDREGRERISRISLTADCVRVKKTHIPDWESGKPAMIRPVDSARVEPSELFGESWRIAPEGQRIVARRCSCPEALLEHCKDGAYCVWCGREPAIRLPRAPEAKTAEIAQSN